MNNELKEKMLAGKKICGTHIALPDPSLAEMVGYLGYDFIWIDMEHSYLSCQDVLIQANGARAAGTPVIVRVPQRDLTATKRVLEMGVEGIVFPMVRSYDEMVELLSWTVYPPDGNRGFGPRRAVRYGLDDEKEFVRRSKTDICRWIQIEHIDIVKDIEKVASYPYLDGCVFGLCDFSGSVGKLCDIYDDAVMEPVKYCIEVLTKHGKYAGISTGATDEASLRRFDEMGIKMISAGLEYSYILERGNETLKNLRRVQK